jgi:hypothetical protein
VFTMTLLKEGRTDGRVTISLCNFVGEGIISIRHQERNFKRI